MLKGVNKAACGVLIVFTGTMIGGCSGKGTGDVDKGKLAVAEKLLAEAKAAVSAGDYEKGLQLLDSINAGYGEFVDLGKEVFNTRLELNLEMKQRELELCTEEINKTEKEFSDVKEQMKRINDASLVEPYWIAKDIDNGKFMSTTGIQARVYDNGEFNLVSNVMNAGNLRHNSLMLVSPKTGESAVSGYVPFDGEINFKTGDEETATFVSEKADALGRFAQTHEGEALELIFNGENGKTKKVTLSAKEVKSLALAHRMSELQQEGKSLVRQQRRIDEELQLSRRQLQQHKK